MFKKSSMDKWWKSLTFREKFYVWKYYENKVVRTHWEEDRGKHKVEK